MKKKIIVAAGLAVLSTSAFATKARMEALGQDANTGSFFMGDSRSVFSNASDVNSMNNYIVTEWGSPLDTDDAQATPHAEGGFFREMGDFAYGVYFGNEYNGQNAERAALAAGSAVGNTTAPGTAYDSFLFHDNALDLFFAGDMGAEWGVRVHYAHSTDERGDNAGTAFDRTHSAFGLGLGIKHGMLSAYANLGINDESEGSNATAGDKFEGDFGLNLGVAYSMAGWTMYADYDSTGFEATDTSTAGKTADYEKTVLRLGAGNTHEVSSTARLYTEVYYTNTNEESTFTASTGATASGAEVSTWQMPVVIGFEADATSWLVLRGSISQELFGSTSTNTKNSTSTSASNDKKNPNLNDTKVNAGATLNFGKLKVDGVIGTGVFGGATAGANTNAGVLNTDNLMSRVAVHYWF
mgnify:CR=1 FL=1|jgi:hypothetical protein